MTKIIAFSDSHGNNNNIKNILLKEKPNIVVHCGDFCCDYDELHKYIDYIVMGNNDCSAKEKIIFNIGKIRIGVIHGHQFFSFSSNRIETKMINFCNENNLDILLYGHTHKELIKKINKFYLVNPGSINYPRNKNHMSSYCIILIENDIADIKIIYLNSIDKWF